MSRYIDADEILKKKWDVPFNGKYVQVVDVGDIEDMPTADVKEPITGHWINKGMDKYELSYGGYAYMPKCECSQCGHIQETYVRGDMPKEDELDYPRFCEMCGSKNAERVERSYNW